MRLNYLLLIIVALLGLWLALNISVYIFQENFIFQGEPISETYQYSFENPVEEIFLRPDSTSRIHALHFRIENPVGVIFYFHGNRGDLSRWGDYSKDFTQYGYDVVMMDYRGYGKSFGNRVEDLLYSDAERLTQNVLELRSYNRVVYLGRSLGSGIAVQLATKRSPDLLILETPFSQLADAIKSYLVIHSLALSRFEFNSLDKIHKINSPFLVIHGTQDHVVPLKYGRKLFEKATVVNKKLAIIQEGGHNNLNTFADYHQTLKTALSDWPYD